MGNITLAIPEDIHTEMHKFSDVRWSEIARKAIVDKLEILKITDKIANKSKLTIKDVKELSNKINASATKRALNEYNNRR